MAERRRRPQVAVDLGSDEPELRQLPVRRLLRRVQRGLLEELAFVAHVPNDEALWSTVRRRAEEVLLPFWREGALPGATFEEACFARCDRTTMTQADVDAGRVVVLVGVAPLRPAEFVLVRIGLWTMDEHDG